MYQLYPLSKKIFTYLTYSLLLTLLCVMSTDGYFLLRNVVKLNLCNILWNYLFNYIKLLELFSLYGTFLCYNYNFYARARIRSYVCIVLHIYLYMYYAWHFLNTDNRVCDELTMGPSFLTTMVLHFNYNLRSNYGPKSSWIK